MKSAKLKQTSSRYTNFLKIDGEHPLKDAVPAAFVGYYAYYREGGKVLYFNFELAKEMGLIPPSHAHELNPDLEEAILQTFSLRILNEFDVLHNVEIEPELIRKNQYMATRYLQLQHPNKQGMTSGDGRSIWNGYFENRKGVWDVSSCGTGATRLSPATAQENRFFQTGDPQVSYGCGLANVSEGVIAALFSEMLHNQGLKTERTLAIISYKNNFAVNVRVNKNLLRPAHFFGFLKRGNRESLRQITDYYIEREQENNSFPEVHDGDDKYTLLLQMITKRFARAAALFESEYLFCWMEWDGDNILMDGGIIDYGIVRQFGLFHHHYRYEDVSQMSTSITEQKNKAKQIVKTFAQAVDFLQCGEKKNKQHFNKHWSMELFDQAFNIVLLQQLLKKIGLQEFQVNTLLMDDECRSAVSKFQKQFRYFEKAVAGRKEYSVPDGVMRDAIFCMRDFLREFPGFYLQHQRLLTADEFIQLVSSDYASRLDRSKYRKQSGRIVKLQQSYLQILELVCDGSQINLTSLLHELIKRVEIINREDKLTGNGVIELAEKILKENNRLESYETQSLFNAIVLDNTLNPDFSPSYPKYQLERSESVIKLLQWGRKKRDKLKQGI